MPDRPPRLLIADDQADVLEALKLLLKAEGFDVETAASPRAVLAALEARDFDALLVDMNYTRDTTSGAEGLDLLSRVQGLESPPPVVVMTARARRCAAARAITSRSPGTTGVCSRPCARRSSWVARCARASVSRSRTAPSAKPGSPS